MKQRMQQYEPIRLIVCAKVSEALARKQRMQPDRIEFVNPASFVEERSPLKQRMQLINIPNLE